MEKEKSTGDFRYAVGAAKVPWHAVGEFYRAGDVLEVVKFLAAASGRGGECVAGAERGGGDGDETDAGAAGAGGGGGSPELFRLPACLSPEQLDRRHGDRLQTVRAASRR